MNRPTVKNVQKAGFNILRVEPVYLDVYLAIEAMKRSGHEGCDYA